jgi:hypothetical protein
MSFAGSSSSYQPLIDLGHNSTALRLSIQAHFRSVTNLEGQVNLFTTDTANLFQAFGAALPASLRQKHNCVSCRKFVDRYGGIVTIGVDGQTIPVMWNPDVVPEIYRSAVSQLSSIISGAAIDNVFLTDLRTWGTPVTGNWEHFSIVLDEDFATERGNIYTVGQLMSEKRQDYEMLLRGLADFPIEVVRQAQSLLSSEKLYRSEKCIGVAKWLLELQQRRESAQNQRVRANITWAAVASAPPGFCHVRSSAIGTLLEDIKDGLTFPEIQARFNAKMNPLQYQRPTAPPSAGNIAQAEKIIEQLQTAGALERRFAKLEDLRHFWIPQPVKAKVESKGIFGHLKTALPKSQKQLDIPPIVMTWDKFARTILPTAKKIEYFVPTTKQSYMAMVTAKNPEAPPIIQWDLEDCRNPVTWYFYATASLPKDWNLQPDAYRTVTAIVLQPSMWNNPENFAHQGEKVFFILQDAKDKQYLQGCGFFPEVLKREYYGIRSTMEAYAQNAVVEGKDETTACGIGLQKGGTWNRVFRVTNQDNMQAIYQLDRWD